MVTSKSVVEVFFSQAWPLLNKRECIDNCLAVIIRNGHMFGSKIKGAVHVNGNRPGSAGTSFVVFNGFLTVLVTYHLVCV